MNAIEHAGEIICIVAYTVKVRGSRYVTIMPATSCNAAHEILKNIKCFDGRATHRAHARNCSRKR